ncbi:hypothetical protein [Vibrio splendidus]|uniref:Uncharacterized protein n=1 Tax=Vibrio splendidus TaxID=29497 RepID=A0A2N7JME4_VIBSP|nr:hypothetical protein [Vibrio splendidus]PMM42866.1 hypothetical protein BCT54_07695 [Vibrio splendidus]
MKTPHQKITLGLAALFFVLPVMAKVTLEDVYKADEAQRAKDLAAFEQYKIDFGKPLKPPIESTAGQVEPWTSLWSGSSTGSIAIPRQAKEVFVKYKKGSTYSSAAFPVNAGTVTIDSISKNWSSNSQNHDRSCSATATARYSNYNVSGHFARGSYSQCDVAIYITKVMYR